MRHLVIGLRQKARNFSAFHWSPHGCLITIGQHFVTTRVVHLPKRTETSLITESDQSRANHQLLQLCTVRAAWSDSDKAVRAVHSCKSWLSIMSYAKTRTPVPSAKTIRTLQYISWTEYSILTQEVLMVVLSIFLPNIIP